MSHIENKFHNISIASGIDEARFPLYISKVELILNENRASGYGADALNSVLDAAVSFGLPVSSKSQYQAQLRKLYEDNKAEIDSVLQSAAYRNAVWVGVAAVAIIGCLAYAAYRYGGYKDTIDGWISKLTP